ncbi:hypothetical protein CEXT_808751 [Caerostris extrusa]|uniref:Uncharacterized protein n=1 Tax=Caerostris extrusa TaxID=172846 RepID=A0AAV4Q8Y3_CAEEX|nr:hypothetical protein CEXT_808751 [Caerostris extrusa]
MARLLYVPDAPRSEAVVSFCLATGHDYLAEHLFRIGISATPCSPLCDSKESLLRPLPLCSAFIPLSSLIC